MKIENYLIYYMKISHKTEKRNSGINNSTQNVPHSLLAFFKRFL